MGCLIGGLGQELSSVSDVFREKISQCFSEIASEMAICLKEARQLGELPKDTNVQEMAERLVDCWEGAALRSRLQRTPASLNSMLDFYFLAVTGVRQRQDAS
jgi:TetR/AcrR family transcriptional repressor of nem operon